MVRVFLSAAGLAGVAGAVFLMLESTAELVAWEVLLLVVLVIVIRNLPRPARDSAQQLFGGREREEPHPPRSVAAFELAAVHAFSETPGSDRRIRRMMRQIAVHRLAGRGQRARSDSVRQMERLLNSDPERPLSTSQIERIVDQLEGL